MWAVHQDGEDPGCGAPEMWAAHQDGEDLGCGAPGMWAAHQDDEDLGCGLRTRMWNTIVSAHVSTAHPQDPRSPAESV